MNSNSFFERHRVQWLPKLSIFANLRSYHDNHAYSDSLDPSSFLSGCLDNCTQFSDPRPCQQYCQSIHDSEVASTNVPGMDVCTNALQCKQLSGTNELRFRECVRRVTRRQPWHSSSSRGESTMQNVLIFLVVIVFVLLCIK